MELNDLIGLHELSGVDEQTESVKNTWGDAFEDCQTINFILDGKTYSAIEDPRDGYRSSMKEIKETNHEIKNVFQPVKVMCAMQADDDWQNNDVLQMTDVITGKIILEVGTTNTDDYYPSFVASFTPENMVINQG